MTEELQRDVDNMLYLVESLLDPEKGKRIAAEWRSTVSAVEHLRAENQRLWARLEQHDS